MRSTLDQSKLVGYGLTVPQVLAALNNANTNVGGQTVNFGDQAAVVRGIGLIHNIDEIANTMVSQNNGSPVLIKDVGSVTISNLPRLGIAGQDNDNDIVMGIVLMRRGAESMPTIKRVEALIDQINALLHPAAGRAYRAVLRPLRPDQRHHPHRAAQHGGGHAADLRPAMGVPGQPAQRDHRAVTIPFALAFAIGLLLLRGESANLLSVGAIDFGLVVDATVIMVENIFRRSVAAAVLRFRRSTSVHAGAGSIGLRGKFAVIANAATEVNKSIFFSAAIIIAGFVPLFTMSGIEGHIFGPMAKTYAYAIAGGLIATFTVTPALCRPVPAGPGERARTRCSCAPSIGLRAGGEFRARQPHLHHGRCWPCCWSSPSSRCARWAWNSCRSWKKAICGSARRCRTSISLEDGNGYVNRMRKIIESYPEVVTVVSQHGRPDDGTDATGFFNAEFFVPLKPFDSWPAGVDKDKLTDDMTKRLNERISRRRFQLLPVHRGQRRRSRIGREGREFGKAVWRRPGVAGKDRRRRSRT